MRDKVPQTRDVPYFTRRVATLAISAFMRGFDQGCEDWGVFAVMHYARV